MPVSYRNSTANSSRRIISFPEQKSFAKKSGEMGNMQSICQLVHVHAVDRFTQVIELLLFTRRIECELIKNSGLISDARLTFNPPYTMDLFIVTTAIFFIDSFGKNKYAVSYGGQGEKGVGGNSDTLGRGRFTP